MAEIFLARRNEGDRKLVVIKRVLPHLLDEDRFIAMFRDEARLASRIIHPNVCQTFEAGTVGHTYFISMEYLHGVPLSRVLLRAARTKELLSEPLVAGLIGQCCDGLEHAHNLKSTDGKPLDVVHRDISPPNIFVTADGYAKLLDFGVAKARGASQKTRTGTVKGKNSYMSPEQILGKEVDRRSDVFSLGVVLWESLTAKRLFSRDTDFLTFKAITEADIPPVSEMRPGITPALELVVARSLARDRDDRYSSALELKTALEEALAEQGGYLSREEVAKSIQTTFSRDLESKNRLITNVTDNLRAISGADMSLDLEVDDVEEKALELESIPAPESGEEYVSVEQSDPEATAQPSFTTTNTHLVDRTNLNRTIVTVAGGLAVAVLAFLALRGFSGGEDASANKDEAAPVQQKAEKPKKAVAQPLPDAGTPKVAVTAIDAAVEPGADAAPKEDTRPGYLTIDSHPYATIYVDSRKIGVTPIFKKRLKAGSHRVKAVSATGATKRMKVNIKPGRTKNLGRLTWPR
jgi:serine/threonine protein kinase